MAKPFQRSEITIPGYVVPISASNCARLQCSVICKNVAYDVVAVHNARPSPLVRQPVSTGMHRALVKHPVLQLQVRARQGVRGALADRVDRADRQDHAEQIAGEL
jgi:hypothetical protein